MQHTMNTDKPLFDQLSTPLKILFLVTLAIFTPFLFILDTLRVFYTSTFSHKQ